MQREIKFRVWDGSKMWLPNDDSDGLFLMLGSSGYFSIQDHSAENFEKAESTLGHKDLDILNNLDDELVLMQYTGLKDKSGKDIYEGDIVQCSQKIKYYRQVVFRNGNYWLINPDRKMDWEIQVVDSSHPDTVVIGNIYENANLLNA